MAIGSQAFVLTEPSFYVVISVHSKPSVLLKGSHLALVNILRDEIFGNFRLWSGDELCKYGYLRQCFA